MSLMISENSAGREPRLLPENDNRILDHEFIENKSLQCPSKDALMEKQSEWEIIDDLIVLYQKQYRLDIEQTVMVKEKSDQAAMQLIEKFQPLFKKYISLLKTGQINFGNAEQRLFVALFMDDSRLRKALYSNASISREIKSLIYYKFNFIKESYGSQDEEEIRTDLYIIFFILAKRYKPKNRSFCCYVYNTIRYEVFRRIQAFTKDPANIHYKNLSYENLLRYGEKYLDIEYIPDFTENNDFSIDTDGLPSSMWIAGMSCSEVFLSLTPLERKILAKYYIENYNDKQLAEEFNLHPNTCNTKRHRAVTKLAHCLGFSKSDIKRTRNPGKR